MIKKIGLIFSIFALLSWSSCATLNDVLNTAGTTPYNPTSGEMSGGLKDALGSGISTAVNILGKSGGYYNDPIVKIPFPKEAEFAAKTLRDIGMGQLVDDFEKKLNEGAEEGAKLALPIFTNAIKQMSFSDVKNILLSGNKQAATDYFKQSTSSALFATFSPTIKSSLDQVGATKLWTDLAKNYNKASFLTGKKIETDLVKYATNRAMDGLFLKVAEKEGLIRSNINLRSTDLMKKVFDWADKQKN